MSAHWTGFRRAWRLALLPLFLSACQGERPGGRLSLAVAHDDATRLMQAINDRAQACWRGDGAFKPYRIIPELDTRVGHPRILLVMAEAPQGLPQFVIQAAGTPVRITTFGPLADRGLSSRINGDVARWSAGEDECKG
jgi:hypothetical protein